MFLGGQAWIVEEGPVGGGGGLSQGTFSVPGSSHFSPSVKSFARTVTHSDGHKTSQSVNQSAIQSVGQIVKQTPRGSQSLSHQQRKNTVTCHAILSLDN